MDYIVDAADKKRSRCFVYHETEKPRIVYSEDANEWYAKGYADSPAKFIGKEQRQSMINDGVPPEAIDMAIKGVTDSLDAQINLEVMTKDERDNYGLDHLQVDVSNLRKAQACKILQALAAGKTHAELGVEMIQKTEDTVIEINENDLPDPVESNGNS